MHKSTKSTSTVFFKHPFCPYLGIIYDVIVLKKCHLGIAGVLLHTCFQNV